MLSKVRLVRKSNLSSLVTRVMLLANGVSNARALTISSYPMSKLSLSAARIFSGIECCSARLSRDSFPLFKRSSSPPPNLPNREGATRFPVPLFPMWATMILVSVTNKANRSPPRANRAITGISPRTFSDSPLMQTGLRMGSSCLFKPSPWAKKNSRPAPLSIDPVNF